MSEKFLDWVTLFFGATPEKLAIDPQLLSRSGQKTPFYAHYNQYVRPLCEQFEERRIQHLKSLQMRLRITVLAVQAMIVLLLAALSMKWLSYADDHIVDALKLIFGVSAALGIWTYQPLRTYRSEVKDEVYPHIFSFYGEKFHYSKSGLLSVDGLRLSGLIPQYDEENNEDYVSGEYRGVLLEFQESKLIKVSRSGNRRSERVVFQGMFLLLNMNKRFQGKTLVLKDGGIIGNWFKQNLSATPTKMEHVALEDPEFEKLFEVYGTHQIEARYLLTTSFMERLKKLCDLMEADEVEASFYNDQLLLMFRLPRHIDRFAVTSIFMPTTFEKDILNITTEMEEIFGIVEHLKLYEQTRL